MASGHRSIHQGRSSSGSRLGPKIKKFVHQTGQKRGYKNCIQCHLAKRECVAVPGRKCQACQRTKTECSLVMDVPPAGRPEQETPALQSSSGTQLDIDHGQPISSQAHGISTDAGTSTSVPHPVNVQHEDSSELAFWSSTYDISTIQQLQYWPTYQESRHLGSTLPTCSSDDVWSLPRAAPQSGFVRDGESAATSKDNGRTYHLPIHHNENADHSQTPDQRHGSGQSDTNEKAEY
ncbi:hypothetical protein PV11_06109 [Exophiala sideris]|uniref:Zn(2)-C6 fungal-type domain-containing protein n=1 Tax=Exophiala sideris TaxID=1016849 RepID=A0A0D1X8K4_9EURO|nr:hypothetical protein PV11_06109 [Exophiala sideris]